MGQESFVCLTGGIDAGKELAGFGHSTRRARHLSAIRGENEY
jgi:hypothetical protein